ncbi:low molecular weight phosphotyrosine protein phosphatase-like [Saccostrea echinata]|uniref:low molecular weight phosphotyrosine protein phosphatase-like n=1 Tax=Saccostrea echinata TaxID=191078 RepID=UPI002A830DF5|nr:low molecular weight phosphotyrosine protein phosphatase-like [Saccostrea echinata]
MEKPFSVLFVCLGNTCRSTMSEGIFRHLVKSKGLQDKWDIDSAGIENWHEGKPPDEFTIEMLKRNNIMDGYHHTARQITEADFMKFKFILGMDLYNIRSLKRKAPPNYSARLQLLGQYEIPGEDPEIYDPYMSQFEVFEEVYAKCLRCCQRFLEAQADQVPQTET